MNNNYYWYTFIFLFFSFFGLVIHNKTLKFVTKSTALCCSHFDVHGSFPSGASSCQFRQAVPAHFSSCSCWFELTFSRRLAGRFPGSQWSILRMRMLSVLKSFTSRKYLTNNVPLSVPVPQDVIVVFCRNLFAWWRMFHNNRHLHLDLH